MQEVIKNPLYIKEFPVEVGKYYLALDKESNEYNRVEILSILDGKADCFFVDYGDFAYVPISDIKYLSDEHIIKLPFQV